MRRRLTTLAVLVTAAVASLTAVGAKAGPPVEVALDNARILVLDDPASDVIIGNPAYADVVLQSPRRLILFGKRVGQTNIIILDDRRREILSSRLVVMPGNDVRVRAPGRGDTYVACGNGRCAKASVGAAGGGLTGGGETELREADGAEAGDEPAVGEGEEEVVE